MSDVSRPAGRVCRVQPDVAAVHRAFDYTVPDALAEVVAVGTIVRVALHGRRVRGWVIADGVEAEPGPERLLPLLAVVSAGPPPAVVELCRWAAWRWAGPLPTFLRAASAPNLVAPADLPEPSAAVYPRPRVGGAAGEVLDALVAIREAVVEWPPATPVGDLVDGLLADEGSTLVVDPDPARAARLRTRLEGNGRDVVAFGSEQPARERTEAWRRAGAGACVVVGSRLTVLAPVPDLAAIVVLDEADEALEEERAPTWNARDVAIERARRAGARIRLVTPAPTVDAVVTAGEPIAPSRLATRAGWPRVAVVDLRDQEPGRGLLTDAVADGLRRAVGAGGRALCVLNRRGRAHLLVCVACKEPARCERCGAAVAELDGRLGCPQCGEARPPVCLECHGTRFRARRPGVARLRDDVAALLPRAVVAAVDASTAAVPDAEVVVGTEAVFHRPLGAARPVLLVAFLELDQELLAPRARAAEQALWLLVRAARAVGPRAGPGSVLVQTRVPGHEVIEAATRAAPSLVVDGERARRRELGFPPFGGVAEVSGDPAAVAAACGALASMQVRVLGPVDGGTRALVRAATIDELCDALAAPALDAARRVGRLRVDVDPRRI